MIAAMDLNASPQPEEDDEPFKRRREDRIESGAEIARRVHIQIPFNTIITDYTSLHYDIFYS